MPLVDRIFLPAYVPKLQSVGLVCHVPANDPRPTRAPAKGARRDGGQPACEPPARLPGGEWAASYDPGVLGLEAEELRLLNDDRVGRALALPFDAHRASLLTEVELRALRRFRIDCSELHNGSTTLTFSGTQRAARGTVRGGKQTAAAKRSFNKDHFWS